MKPNDVCPGCKEPVLLVPSAVSGQVMMLDPEGKVGGPILIDELGYGVYVSGHNADTFPAGGDRYKFHIFGCPHPPK